MVNLDQERLNLDFREIEVDFESIFPRLNRERIAHQFAPLKRLMPHVAIYRAAQQLADGGYTQLLQEHGFWEGKSQEFTGHCHQSTPALGLALNGLDLAVSYLECFRINPDFEQTSKIEMVDPREEKSAMRDRFIEIGRIPYCCLEVQINGRPFYLSPKHLHFQKREPLHAMLTPECYMDFDGYMRHQLDRDKSGIYLETVTPPHPVEDLDSKRMIIWRKQKLDEPSPELFATYLRMNLV